MYANVCFFFAIFCFVLDGLNLLQHYHPMSWGSALFAAGFVVWEMHHTK